MEVRITETEGKALASRSHTWQATRRSLLRRATQRDAEALSALCAVYWKPVYGLVRAYYRVDHALASDITQGVFANLLQRDLRKFDLERGSRFRSWLKRVVHSHANNVFRGRRRLARVEEAVDGTSVDPAALALHAGTQDHLFDQCTALSLIARAWERVERDNYPDSPRLFLHLRQSLCAEPTELSDAELSRALGNCESYVRKARHDVKTKLFPQAFRAEMRSLGVSEANLDQELRALLDSLA